MGELLEFVVVFPLLLVSEVFHGLAQKIFQVLLLLPGSFKDAPAHLIGNDFIAVGMVHVFFEQLKIFLRVLILLLQETLPFVFVPGVLVRGFICIGHF